MSLTRTTRPIARPGDAAPTTRTCLVLVCVVLLASAWLRGPAWSALGFASNDVGGILVNARVLEEGGLPYVDTVELKSPGTFYLAAALVDHGPTAIQALTWWANAFALASLALCAALAWRWFGPRAAVACAVLLALHDAWLDSMDANYVTWANVPALAAGGMAMEAMACARDGWRRGALWLASGAFGAMAALCKTPAGVVVVAAAMMIAWDAWAPRGHGGGRSREAADTAREPLPRTGTVNLRGASWDALALLAGVVAGHAPVALHYASHGAIDALLASYPVSGWVTSYVSRRATSPLDAARELAFASAHHVAPLLTLAGLRAAWWRRSEPLARSDAYVVPLLAWAVAMLLATAVGLRFYKGYFVSVAPPLALLASSLWSSDAHPLRRPRGQPWRSPAAVAQALAAALMAGLLLRQGVLCARARAERAQVVDAGARQLGSWIAAQSAPDDRIWVWGWHLWPVYAYADRRPGAAMYKSLGLLTPPNDDTWRTAASPLVFVEGQWSERILAELRATPPRFILLGGTVPRDDFAELRALLRADYRRVRELRVGRVEIWEHRGAKDPPTRPTTDAAPRGELGPS